MDQDAQLDRAAQAAGFPLDEPIRIGGHYAPTVRDGDLLYVSGQVPRIGQTVVVVGAVGQEVSMGDARRAAVICTLRALVLVRQAVGSLRQVQAVPRMNVFVRSAPDFTQQSEVADAASDLLVQVLGERAVHARTSVGVLQLPKGAAVEIDLVCRVAPDNGGV